MSEAIATPGHTQVRQPWLKLIQGFWLLITITVAVSWVIGAPATLAKALTVSPETVQELAQLGLPPWVPGAILFGTDILTILVFGGFALLLFIQRRDDWMALFVGQFLLLTAVVYSGPLYDGPFPMWLPCLLVGAGETSQALFVYLFPDGRFVPRWLRWIPLPLLIWRVAIWYFNYMPGYRAGGPGSAENYGYVAQNSIDIGLFTLLLVGGIVAQIVRYRRLANEEARAQARWMLYGMTITLSLVGTYVFVFNVLEIIPPDSAVLVTSLGRLARQIALSAVPVTLAIAILRYRLWDINFVINRSLVYGLLTLVLGLVFGGIWLAIQSIAQRLMGGQPLTVLGIGISTIVVALLFQPVRNWLRHQIDERVYGIRFDYRKAAVTSTEMKEKVAAANPSPTRTSFHEIANLRLIGHGGMGEVYQGRHPELRRTVAVKILSPAFANDVEMRERFLREAEMLGRLNHANVVRLYEMGSDEPPFMVMEYIDGPTLASYLDDVGRLTPEVALPLLEEIGAALDATHAAGIVHRDVKPANIMLDSSPLPGSPMPYRVVLMDFGIAFDPAAKDNPTESGVAGTLDYIAPEQIQGRVDIDGRADVYALGVMSFQVLCGQLPFRRGNPAATIMAHLSQPAPDPRSLTPDLRPALARAVMRAMAKQAADRFRSAGEFVAAMRA